MGIVDFLNGLTSSGGVFTIDQVRTLANDNGYTNQQGEPYTSNRGFGRTISTAYDKLMASGNQEGAKRLADSITDKNGHHAWENKY